MLLKVLGAALAVTAAFLLGQFYASKLKRRCDQIQQLLAAFHLIEAEIRYKLSPREDILKKIKKAAPPSISALFCAAPPAEDLALGKSDLEVVNEFMQSFGKLDMQSQLDQTAFCVRRLEEHLEQAKESFRKYGRLIRVFAPLFVLAFCLLFF